MRPCLSDSPECCALAPCAKCGEAVAVFCLAGALVHAGINDEGEVTEFLDAFASLRTQLAQQVRSDRAKGKAAEQAPTPPPAPTQPAASAPLATPEAVEHAVAEVVGEDEGAAEEAATRAEVGSVFSHLRSMFGAPKQATVEKVNGAHAAPESGSARGGAAVKEEREETP